VKATGRNAEGFDGLRRKIEYCCLVTIIEDAGMKNPVSRKFSAIGSDRSTRDD